MKKILILLVALAMGLGIYAQTPVKIYDETIDPNVQITEAVGKAKADGKFVVALLGGGGVAARCPLPS